MTVMRPFDIGLVVGRFQNFHEGHKSLIDLTLQMCDRCLILVGSSQEEGTERNPFSVATRIDCIKSLYGDNVIIRGLPDMTDENDIRPEWGKYLLKHVENIIHKKPDVMVYGNDESRSKWFDQEDIKDILEVIVPRSRIEISGTQMRDFLLKDEAKEWHKYAPNKLHKYYERLRSELLSVEYYRDEFKRLLNGGNKIRLPQNIADIFAGQEWD